CDDHTPPDGSPIAGDDVCARAGPESITRAGIPGLSDATRCWSVVMPRMLATAMPRPDKHLVSSYSNASIDGGRSSGLRDIACITSWLTSAGIVERKWLGDTGSTVAFLV